MKNSNSVSKLDYELLKQLYPNNINEIMLKIKNNYPVQYLIGYVDFYGYKINVDERVLIPRFETEGLVENVIKFVKEYITTPLILDIGTGSGCIAITLSKELNVKVDAIDISSSAIDVATLNAQLNNASVSFFQKDIKNCSFDTKYNVLVSNPPYVKIGTNLDSKIKYEPQNAIFAKDNGLEFYKIILKQSKDCLLKKNIIAFEIGDNETEDIKKIIKEFYPNGLIIIKQDLSGLDRYIIIINE